jgi:hypothetical protein
MLDQNAFDGAGVVLLAADEKVYPNDNFGSILLVTNADEETSG